MSDSGENSQVGRYLKDYFTHSVVVCLVPAFVFAMTVPAIGETWKETLRIGILAPTVGPDKILGKQIEIGAKLGIQATKKQMGNIKFIKTTNWDGKDISFGLAQLQKKNVDVMIGGATSTATTEFYKLVAKHSIPPTIMLANIENKGRKDQRILHMGISPEMYYKDNLHYWTKKFDLKKIGVMYDQSNKNTLRYGKDLTLKALKDAKVGYHMIPYGAMQAEDYSAQMKKLANYNPDAIILAGRSWDVKNLIYGMSKSFNVPLFLSRPMSTQEMKKFASVISGSIYIGTQWPLFNDSKLRPFIYEVNKRLGWHGQVFSPIAIKAYDAEQVLAKALVAWRMSGDIPSSEPWDMIIGAKIQGLADVLSVRKYMGSNTVLASEYLYEFTAADSIKRRRMGGDAFEKVKTEYGE